MRLYSREIWFVKFWLNRVSVFALFCLFFCIRPLWAYPTINTCIYFCLYPAGGLLNYCLGFSPSGTSISVWKDCWAFAVCVLIRVGFLILTVSFLGFAIWETVMLNQSSKSSGDHFQLHYWFIFVLARWLQVPVTVQLSFGLPYLSLPVLNLRVKSHVTHLPERKTIQVHCCLDTILLTYALCLITHQSYYV